MARQNYNRNLKNKTGSPINDIWKQEVGKLFNNRHLLSEDDEAIISRIANKIP